MIVFEQDWRYYPNAIVDERTNNPSFLRMASVLKKMGVRHYYFPLALHNPALQGIDPHDTDNLDSDTKAMILWEADQNPWYYLRELVIDKGAGLTVDECRFRCNRGSIASMWLTLASIDYIRIQPRQTGKSFETDAISLWLLYFCYQHTTMNLITNTNNTRVENINRLKKIRDALPDYVLRNTNKDDNNQQSLSCIKLSNRFFSHVSQSSEKGADNLGRGLTSPRIQFDEAPFINHIQTTVSAAMGSTNTAREIAKRKHMPFCTVFTTTAGDKETRDGRYVYNLWSSAAVWNETYYDCKDRDELVDRITKNSHSPAPTVNLTLSHSQLGFSDQWLYDSIARARSENGIVIERDYFNRWTSSSTSTPIGESFARKIRGSELEAMVNEISDEQYVFRWYDTIDSSQMYVIGLDTSDAVGRDEIAMTVTNTSDGSLTGAGAYNETNVWRFAKWLLQFMLNYPNTVLIAESKSSGQTIMDYLIVRLAQYNFDPTKRIFNYLIQEKEKHQDDLRKISGPSGAQQLSDRFKRYFGFNTTGASREKLYSDVLNIACEHAADLVRDKQLIHQLLSLTVRNGRIDHREGDHDDMVIAWLMSHWLLNFGVNLSHYGIKPAEVLTKRLEKIHENDPQRQAEIRQHQRILSQIEQIQQRLQASESQFEIQRLEGELASLSTHLSEEDQEVYSLDALLEQARQKRQQTHPVNRGHTANERSGNRKLAYFFSRS